MLTSPADRPTANNTDTDTDEQTDFDCGPDAASTTGELVRAEGLLQLAA